MDYDASVFGMFGGQEKYEESLDALVEFARLSSHTSVLEVCCGTGISTKHILQRTPQVTAVELNRARLEHARKHLPREVTLLAADALHLSPDDHGLFDVVLCINGFHYFQDPNAFYAVAQRMLKPGGRLVFNVKLRDYKGIRPFHFYASDAVSEVFKMRDHADHLAVPRIRDSAFISSDYAETTFSVPSPFRIARKQPYAVFFDDAFFPHNYVRHYWLPLLQPLLENLYPPGSPYRDLELFEAELSPFGYRALFTLFDIAPPSLRLVKSELFVEAVVDTRLK